MLHCVGNLILGDTLKKNMEIFIFFEKEKPKNFNSTNWDEIYTPFLLIFILLMDTNLTGDLYPLKYKNM